jgi:paraquat-inducible protein A
LSEPNVITATQLGLVRCSACSLVVQEPEAGRHAICPRCEAPLHRRLPNSLARTWALLIAAAVLYIPANLFPIMRTASLGEVPQSDTILSGVVELWVRGSWDLAIIVFVASIVVPLLKIAILMTLLITTGRHSSWRRKERGKLYRFVEFIGHWSMLDIFVVALMAALVRFQSLADVTPGPGAVAFGAVVVLTMLASKSFDERLIWDPPEGSDAS